MVYFIALLITIVWGYFNDLKKGGV